MRRVVAVFAVLMMLWASVPASAFGTSYPDPTADILSNPTAFDWASLANVATAFGNAHTAENAMGLPGSVVMPTLLLFPLNYDTMSHSEKAAWIINWERTSRGLFPFEGIDPAVEQVAQGWAQHLTTVAPLPHNAGRQAQVEAACDGCAGNLQGGFVAENLAWSSGFGFEFGVERAIYDWMYEDGGSAWGHRHALLWNDQTNDHGPAGSEGFLGIGVATQGVQQWVVFNATDTNAVYPSAASLDLLLQENGGQVAVWGLNGTALNAGAFVANAGPDWRVVGSGAFTTGDSDTDVVMQNTATGEVGIWKLTGTTLTSGFSVANPGPDWMVKGVGQFTADSNLDLVIQNTVSGEVGIWQLTGTTLTAGISVANPGPNWVVKGTGQFTADANTDLVLQNTVSGEVGIWQLTGTGSLSTGIFVANPGPQWVVRDVGHDLVMQNTVTGQVAVWQLIGPVLSTGYLVANPGTQWVVKGAGQFTADANLDVVLEDTGSGQVAIWQLTGTGSLAAGSFVANAGPTWLVEGIGHFAP